MDPRDVGWQDSYVGVPQRDDEPIYDGVWRCRKADGPGGETEECSLKFACRPHQRADGVGNSGVGKGPEGVSMGKVEIELHKKGDQVKIDDFPITGDFARYEETAHVASNGSPKKLVRSKVGVAGETQHIQPLHYLSGVLIQNITLHYCTAYGLIQVGILPKPSNMYHIHQVSTGKRRATIPPPLVSPERAELRVRVTHGNQVSTQITYHDSFDLTGLNSDSDDDDTDEEHDCAIKGEDSKNS
jgi:hypothetical protein